MWDDIARSDMVGRAATRNRLGEGLRLIRLG